MKAALRTVVLTGLSVLCAGSSLAFAEGAAAGAFVATTPAHHAAVHAEKLRVVREIRIYERGKTMTLKDLKAGQRVSVQEKTGASGQAESIHIIGVEAA